MRHVRPLLAGALAAGALLAAPANATCVGEDSLIYFCALVPTVQTTPTTYCFYVASGTCQPVDVPVPSTSGDAGLTCGGTWCPHIEPIFACDRLDIYAVCS